MKPTTHEKALRLSLKSENRIGNNLLNLQLNADMKQIDLSGKTAIITGASQGIGLATAKSLHAAGANVVINYFEDSEGHNRELAAAVVAELGSRAIELAADVRDSDQLAEMNQQAVAKFGGLDSGQQRGNSPRP